MYIATGIRTGSLFFLVLEHPVALSYCYPAREPKHAHMALANSDAIAIIMSELGKSIYGVIVFVGLFYSGNGQWCCDRSFYMWGYCNRWVVILRFYGRSIEFMHRLGCYDSCNEISLTTILKHFACGRIWCTNVSHIKCAEAQTGIIHLFWIYLCHSNRSILSPILLSHSDGRSLCSVWLTVPLIDF